uniref:Ubiquitin carboxyl-terminal hydrolase n=1 Tax=Homalodisca liturata TaxID=320908 RepID=A0A1B6J488_9HEMI
MPVSVKKLHIAKGLSELKEKNSIANVSNILSNNESGKIVHLVEVTKKLYDSALAELDEAEKDEEKTFIYLFRYMELWTSVIFKSDEYLKHKKYYKEIHGDNIKKVIELLEKYTEKLQQRYAELNESVEEDSGKVTYDLSSYKLESSITMKKKKIEIKDAKDNPVINGGKNHIFIQDKGFRDKDNHKQEISDTNNDLNYVEEKKFIHCAELKKMLPTNKGVLILDIRPSDDFKKSKISQMDCVNIPATSINAGLSANKLGELITDNSEKFYWNHREEYQQLVLLDWHSEEKDVIPASRLDILRNILLKWDPQVKYKNDPLILVGGYERWLDMYPVLTTDSKIECPPKNAHDTFIPLSDHSIEYPISDLDKTIVSKPERREIPTPAIPIVDRSTKPEKILGVVDKPDPSFKLNKEVTSGLTVVHPEFEPMEEDKVPVKPEFSSTSSVSASKDNIGTKTPNISYPQVVSSPVRPKTPPRLEKFYPTTPKKSADKGDGDIGTSFERLKSDSESRSGGLKRSISSPNINKLADEDMNATHSSFSPSPKFDRSNKPKPQHTYESYTPRNADNDIVYLANNKNGRGLTGLKNLGNLCYMNSIMQCISNTVELTKELTKFNPKEVSGRRQIASEVSSLLRILWLNDARITSCRSLKGKVGALRQSFSTSEQQDSHEFLTLLIDWLHEDLNEPSHIKSLEGAVEDTGEKAWGEFQKKNNSLILNLFYGQLKSTVTCNHCQKQSVLFEPFSNLSIPLPTPQDTPHDKDRRCTLQECLRLYLKGENISGWKCPSCNTPREATKKLDITRLPPVLIIHLKRFMNDMVGVGWCRKRMNMVDFPVVDFDMKPYTHQESELRFHNYNLYAVSNHYGSMDSGHYTAYCKNYLLNKWYKFDDQDVNELSPNEIRTSAAYILFYESSHIDRLLD